MMFVINFFKKLFKYKHLNISLCNNQEVFKFFDVFHTFFYLFLFFFLIFFIICFSLFPLNCFFQMLFIFFYMLLKQNSYAQLLQTLIQFCNNALTCPFHRIPWNSEFCHMLLVSPLSKFCWLEETEILQIVTKVQAFIN